MKMTIKKKMVTGGVVAALVTGVGFGLANTDAGGKLEEWYNDLFGKTGEKVISDARGYGESRIPGFIRDYETDKRQVSLTLDEKRLTEQEKAIAEIENAKKNHLNSLNDRKSQILGGMNQQLEQVFQSGVSEIEKVKNQGLSIVDNDLKAYVPQQGETALNNLKGDINASKDAAVSELEEAIKQAKQNIKIKLDEGAEKTTKRLEREVDIEIGNAKAEVTRLINKYVNEQGARITAEAKRLESSAKADLDAVVANMNN